MASWISSSRLVLSCLGVVSCTWLASVAPASAEADNPRRGQIVVDRENPSWLKYHRRGPLFLAGPGDPEGFLFRGERLPGGTRRGDQKKLIRKLAKTGANSIYLMAVRSHGGDGDSTQNPFQNHDPSKPLSQAILRQWNRWFRLMDRNGITIFFFIYDDGSEIWRTGDEVGPAERAFLRGLVNRFKQRRRLIWVVAEEYQERYSAKRVSAIAEVIQEADNRGHPVAVHKLTGLGFGDFAEDPNIDQFAVQFRAPSIDDLHDAALLAWRDAGGRYNVNFAEVTPWGTGAEARRRAWALAMAGSYVMVFGMDIENTALHDLEDLGRLVNFMQATDVNRMEPRDDLAAGETQYVLARPGESYIAYTSQGVDAVGVRDLHAGTYEMLWLDTVSGKRSQEVLEISAGDHQWLRPSPIGEEMVLYLKRIDSGSAGDE